MSLKLLLTVDLNSVNESQRQKFYKYLEDRGLKKTNLTTTWKATFDSSSTHEKAAQLIKKILVDASVSAKITNYEAQFMISDNAAISVRQ